MSTSRIEKLARYCQSVLGFDYYDGPTCGVGVRHDGIGLVFQWVAADREHWNRVFLVAPIPIQEVEQLWNEFALIESPRYPVWVPQSDGDGVVRERIAGLIKEVREQLHHADDVQLVKATSLVRAASQLKPLDVCIPQIRELLSSGRIVSLPTRQMLESLESQCLDKFQ